jgi:hypothetical protein
MTMGVVLALLAIGLACALMPYGRVAMERGWPCGTIHSTDMPVFIGLSFIALALGRLIYAFVHQGVSWWVLSLVAVSWFIVSPFVVNTFKGYTTQVAIIGAPLLLAASLFVR